MSNEKVEIWRRVDSAKAFRREGDWLEVDLKDGGVLRIHQPAGKDGGRNEGTVKHEGPVVFENFRYDDDMPAPGTPVTEDCRIKVKDGAWKTSGFTGTQKVIAAQVKVNGTWMPPEGNPPPHRFIQCVHYDPGFTPTLTWKNANG